MEKELSWTEGISALMWMYQRIFDMPGERFYRFSKWASADLHSIFRVSNWNK